jgi:hypothetical protein
MKKRTILGALGATTALPALGAAIALPALAAGATEITVSDPWARPNLPGRPTAAYMRIENAGETADRLTGASSPLFGTIELHTTLEEDGVMKMQAVEAIEAPAGGGVSLAPGGYHLMLFEPAEALREGTHFPLVLEFERAGAVGVTVPVERRGAGKGHGSMDHGSE